MSWQNNFQNFKNHFAPEDAGSLEARSRTFDRFLNLGLPTKKEEAWKFTSLSNFKSIDWNLSDEDEALLTHEQMQEVSKQLPSEFINFVFVNGVLNATLSDDADGLIDLWAVDQTDLKSDERNVEDRLLNLAKSFLNKKINLKLSKNKTIEKVIHIVFVQSSKKSVYSSEKLNIHLEENSEAKILIHTMSFVNSTADALNLNVDIQLEKSARMIFVQLQNEDLASYHFSQCHLQLEALSQVTTLVLSLGNLLTRNYYNLKFNSENAQARSYGLSILDAQQHADNYTFIQHAIGNNQSTQHYKSILAGSSRSVFRGRVLIEPDAQKANSEQLNNNLLLTRTAQADSIPQLEIFADDVKAGHGATFGQLSKDEIFYFLSRGINQYQAVKMLSYGYAKELILKIENRELQNYLVTTLNRKLESMVQNG